MSAVIEAQVRRGEGVWKEVRGGGLEDLSVRSLEEDLEEKVLEELGIEKRLTGKLPNSIMNCRHIPHGDAGPSRFVTMAIALEVNRFEDILRLRSSDFSVVPFRL